MVKFSYVLRSQIHLAKNFVSLFYERDGRSMWHVLETKEMLEGVCLGDLKEKTSWEHSCRWEDNISVDLQLVSW